MTKRWIVYSAEELEWLEANRTLVIGDYLRCYCDRFGRTDVSAENLNSLRKRKGWRTGRTGHFGKGHHSWNEGMTGFVAPGSEKGWFKKGQLPHNTKHLGHEHVRTDGYVEISVADPNPHTGFERRYVQKHKWLWEQVNGPVPVSHALKCIDGNKQNTDPSNWTAIPKAILPALGGRSSMPYDSADPEIKPALLLRAKVRHAIRKAVSK